MNLTKFILLLLYICAFEASLSSAKPQNITMSASDGIYLTLTLDKVAKTYGSILTYGNGELQLTKTIYNSYQFSIRFKSEKIGSEKIPLEFSYNLADHKRDEPFILFLKENKICLIVEKVCHRECLKYLNAKGKKTVFVKTGLQATKNASEVFGRKGCNFYNLTQIAPHPNTLVSSDFCLNKWHTYSFHKSIAFNLAYNSQETLNDFAITNDGNYVLLRSIYGEHFILSHLQIDVFTPSGKQIAIQKLEFPFSVRDYVTAASLTLDPQGFIYAYIAMYAPYESRSAHIIKFNSTLPHAQIASTKSIYGTDPSLMFSNRFGYIYFIAESNYAVFNTSLALLANESFNSNYAKFRENGYFAFSVNENRIMRFDLSREEIVIKKIEHVKLPVGSTDFDLVGECLAVAVDTENGQLYFIKLNGKASFKVKLINEGLEDAKLKIRASKDATIHVFNQEKNIVYVLDYEH